MGDKKVASPSRTMPGLNIRLLDQIIIVLGFLLLVVIGIRCARRSQTDEGYFLAGRSMPGWVVGFSLMATIVSSLTFLGLPAFAFGDANWRNVLSLFTYIPAVLVAVYLFIPFYRSMRVRSAYEYLELRFGLWARIYAAAAFVLFHFFRTGLVLYAVSLAIRSILGTDEDSLPVIIIVAGILVSAYTILGGLQAVIWTDVFQGIALIGGGLLCLPIIVSQLPGGFAELLQVAEADNKFDLGSTDLTLHGKTVWAYIVAEFMILLQISGTDQTNVQRYAAARSDKDAYRGAIIGCCLAVPTWTYFVFLGTALYVFVKVVPNTGSGGAPSGRRISQIHPDSAPRRLGRAGVDRTARVRHVDVGFEHQRHGGHRHHRLLPETMGQGSRPPSLCESRKIGQFALQRGDDHDRLYDPPVSGLRDSGRSFQNVPFDPRRRSFQLVRRGDGHLARGQPGGPDRHRGHGPLSRRVAVRGHSPRQAALSWPVRVRARQLLGERVRQSAALWSGLFRQPPDRKPARQGSAGTYRLAARISILTLNL